ncbi:uncharacterized protein LOC100679286 [Nasonia vitripennis]|uniref:Uncharacterized protein n=1 Tax=Nasonia vitripennis TaxID=7425 RepID=A0A7M7PZL0_NASVI|nr:uncharacterized protein LOC100679286 [Nasonia vitripennis]XP_016840693.1 uncharacterized protein LOC100679286 [Nasonia vitripennis]XP_031778214.1 uncharacterized protein LOC100679286 [Nasonia vitripennis]
MTSRLLLVLALLAVHLVDGGADPIPEPCHKAESRESPVWKLLCEQLLKSVGRSNASEAAAGDGKALKGGVEGVGRQTEPKKAVVNVKLLEDVSSPQESNSLNSRQHKAFFVDYPASQRVYQDKSSSSVRKKQQKKPPSKSKNKKPESEIFFIRLPPTPYSYVPGLGYISQPPSFSTASLAGSLTKPPPPQRNTFIKLPIEFVSNGKPTAVYRWPSPAPPSKQKPSKTHHQKYRPDSPIIKLNRGPYIFDGRPKSVYLMKRNPATRPNRF